MCVCGHMRIYTFTVISGQLVILMKSIFSYMQTNSSEFNLGEALQVVKNQAMILSRERLVQVIYDSPADVSSMLLYGDNLRLQQVLSDFLTNALSFTPAFEESSVLLKIIPRKKRIGTKIHVVHLEFRYCSFIVIAIF